MHYFKEDLVIAIAQGMLTRDSYEGREDEFAEQVIKYAEAIDKRVI